MTIFGWKDPGSGPRWANAHLALRKADIVAPHTIVSTIVLSAILLATMLILPGCATLAAAGSAENNPVNRQYGWSIGPNGGDIEQNIAAQVVNNEDLVHGQSAPPNNNFSGVYAQQAIPLIGPNNGGLPSNTTPSIGGPFSNGNSVSSSAVGNDNSLSSSGLSIR